MIPELEVNPVYQAIQDHQAQLDQEEMQDQQAQVDHLDHLGQLEILVLLDLKVNQGNKVHLVHKVLLAPLVSQDQPVQEVKQAIQDQSVGLELQVLLGQEEIWVCQVHQVLLAQVAH